LSIHLNFRLLVLNFPAQLSHIQKLTILSSTMTSCGLKSSVISTEPGTGKLFGTRHVDACTFLQNAHSPEQGEPPVKEPPAKVPPVEQPPAKQPPIEEPPIGEPPVEQPPVKQPPVEEPPAEDPRSRE